MRRLRLLLWLSVLFLERAHAVVRIRGGIHQSHKHKRRHPNPLLRTHGRSTTLEALDALPAGVGQVFIEFQRATSTDREKKAAELLAQLNAASEHAMSVEETIGLECQEKKEDIANELTGMKAEVTATESQAALAQDRTESLKAAHGRALAEIRSAQAQSDNHRARCTKNQDLQQRIRIRKIRNLTADKAKAKELISSVTADCASGSGNPPPALIECTMPDGAIIPTFKDKNFRLLGAGLGDVAQSLLYANLDTALHQSRSIVSLLETRWLGLSSKRLRHHRGTRRSFARAPDVSKVPDHKCTDAVAMTCSGFLDSMATFLGHLDDAIQNARAKIQAKTTHCDATMNAYQSLMSTLYQQADSANEAIASWTAEQNSYTALRRTQRKEVEDLRDQAERMAKQCEDRLSSAADAKVAAERMWQFLKASGTTGTFVGDCEVTHWVPGPCSKPCGKGGLRNYTRRVVWKGSGQGQQCPKLQMTRQCNEKPCPIDGKVGRWQEWSGCSKLCGGGTRTRHREKLSEPQHGGRPNPETEQQEICNAQTCESDCELLGWTAWSSCSNACGGGHRTRFRHVKSEAAGRGRCPAPDDPTRREAAPCNATDVCSANNSKVPHCSSALDIVLVLDGSGSVGANGFADIKQFVTSFASRLGFAATLARMGLVAYSGSAQVVQDLVADRAIINQKLTALQWPSSQGDAYARSSNAAAALALARTLLEGRRSSTLAQPVVVVVTDGTPSSSRLLSSEVRQLKESGVRMTFVATGAGSAHRVKRWASWPKRENVISARTYKALKAAARVTELVADICPVLNFP